MIGTVKAAGLLLIFISCAAAGFSAAYRLKTRLKVLEETVCALERLDSRLRYEGTERKRLLRAAFGDDRIVFEGNAAHFNAPSLKKEDTEPIRELLASFGGGDTEAEHSRIRLCRELTEERVRAAAADHNRLGRVYCTLGLCVGAVCCLIFI